MLQSYFYLPFIHSITNCNIAIFSGINVIIATQLVSMINDQHSGDTADSAKLLHRLVPKNQNTNVNQFRNTIFMGIRI